MVDKDKYKDIDNKYWIDIKGNCKCCDNFRFKCKPNQNIFEIILKSSVSFNVYTIEEGKKYSIMDSVNFFKLALYLNFEKNDSKIIEFVESEELHFNCYKQLAWYYIYDIYIVYEFPHEAKEEGYPIEDLMLDYLYWSFGDPTEPGNYFYDKFESEEDKYYIYENESKIRRHQKKFRDKLLEKNQNCKICGLEFKDLLVASHIKAYSKCSNYESKDIYNGFILCNKHDKLFDLGLITFEDDGNMIVSNKLSFKDREILELNENIKIDLEEGNLKYLKWHREFWFKR